MVDFRRWITALAVIALFVAVAGAQVSNPSAVATPSLTCTATVAVPPQLRAEGITELIGDIVLTCTGGTTTLTPGAAIPTANITVSLGTNVTSRLLSVGTANVSEATLLIDEPGSGLAPVVTGFGPGAAQIPCSANAAVGAGAGGCTEYYQTVAAGGGAVPVASGSATTVTPGANDFLGVVNGNQVTFFGVPILAPVSAGTARVFRITNVRANVSGLGGGGLPGTSQLLASVAISGSTSLPVSNPVLIAGFIQQGLGSTALRNPNNTSALSTTTGTSFLQCQTQTTSGVSVIQFTEGFGTAFKTRTAPTLLTSGVTSTQTNGQEIVQQNIPGTIYNSESGFINFGYNQATVGGITTATAVPGLADFGTRLKATFNNVPTGVRIFVSVTNLASNTSNATTPAPPAGSTLTSYAVLVTDQNAPEGSNIAPSTSIGTGSPTGGTAIAEIPVTAGTATAVWEIYNTNPAAIETLNFGVFTSFTQNAANNTPPTGTATVSLSFAPTSTATTAQGAGASIPRFADTSAAKPILTLNLCQTLLLFPFVTNLNGFDTGIAIANTTSDPIGTGAQSGTCSLTWYNGAGTTPAVTTPSIATGTVYTTLVSTSASGFQGYMFAQCNFLYAHGFAFISDVGARNLAMGYLALVVNNGQTSRGNAPSAETLGN
jgi:hypothetical protein